jgi:hypothetical protein
MLHCMAKQEGTKDATLLDPVLTVIVGGVVAMLVKVEELTIAPFVKHLKQGQ